ncbi:enoyl-CoA hydratase/isomerase family protein [Rhodopseudomonas pseudopalustris]|uniref:Enoyl-CoA hydratase/carnithine racemase n=1 Tax=Rhodopseudomonas pseudopalustris TaxID=1513892 RepID=A0A1H8M7M7_9BRAD|nr:enoyl-CoA hydratase/isomerase family protein [Rhodopseudomonas pseudopalustris]SEO13218.1 Enoyl-CoA hydratase/carnithine racemase [Rhodopseudomonas pseudopalustris]
MEHLTLSRPAPDLAVVQLRGAGRVNLMSYAMLEELWRVANDLQSDRAVRVVIVTGSEQAFSAGMNLRQKEVSEFESYSIEERLQIHSIGARACKAWEDLHAVTIGAIEGYCIGGGLAFASALDYRVASSMATLSAPELRHGMNMSWQSVPRLVALVGPAKARRLIMLAEQVAAADALAWGLVDVVCDPGAALASAEAEAQRFLAMPAAPLRMTKQAINQAAGALSHAASYMDLEQYVLCQSTQAHRDSIDAFTGRS